MRLFLTIFLSLAISATLFFIVKFWGMSQHYVAYQHPIYQTATAPLIFSVASPSNYAHLIKSRQPFFINLAITADQQLILHFSNALTNYRTKTFSEISTCLEAKECLRFLDEVSHLKNQVIILNLTENPMSGPDIIAQEFAKAQFSTGETFIFSGPYEAPLKELKIRNPTWLFGSTKPEILRMKAMESLWLTEAATYRADVVIHSLKLYDREFFTTNLLADIQRRFKKIIVGPVKIKDLPEAKSLQPFAIIVED
jgi:hypothetical protein